MNKPLIFFCFFNPNDNFNYTLEVKKCTSTNSGKVVPKNTNQININTASNSDLQSLPGIGSSKDQSIIDHRPYKTIDGILKVSGIGKGTYAKIKELITVK